jgi:hypothetical protein
MWSFGLGATYVQAVENTSHVSSVENVNDIALFGNADIR